MSRRAKSCRLTKGETVKRLVALIAAFAAALMLSGTALAHLPFTNGDASARALQKSLVRGGWFKSARCSYLHEADYVEGYPPYHVICNGLIRPGKGGTAFVHRARPRLGLLDVCSPDRNYVDRCRRYRIRLSS